MVLLNAQCAIMVEFNLILDCFASLAMTEKVTMCGGQGSALPTNNQLFKIDSFIVRLVLLA